MNVRNMKGDRWAVSQATYAMLESGLLQGGVKAHHVHALALEIVARLSGRTVEQVRAAICDEIIHGMSDDNGEWGIKLTDVMLYDAGREDGRREAQAEVSRLTRELEEARGRERSVRDTTVRLLEEINEILADMHDGDECLFNGGEGCLACFAQERIGSLREDLEVKGDGDDR